MALPKVLLTRTLPPESQQLIENAKDIELIHWKDDIIPRDQMLKLVLGVNGILCMLTEKIDLELLDKAGPNLKVVSTCSVGYDHVDLNELRKRKIHLGNTPDVPTDATAGIRFLTRNRFLCFNRIEYSSYSLYVIKDITALLVLAAARRIREGIHAIEDGKWSKWSPVWMLGTQLTDKTVGIVGFGRIGAATACRLKPFLGANGKILYSGNTDKPMAVPLNAIRVEFNSLVRDSDIICICCYLNEKTKEMFNYDVFKMMKKNV
ncbi:4219_t:CDS:2, partial [Scutellospora calospora]